MKVIDALRDGHSALIDLQGASPAGGQVTSQPAARGQLTPGDVVRYRGAWTVVAAASHDGIHGVSAVLLITAAGDLIRDTLVQTDMLERRGDTRIDPDTLYKLLPDTAEPSAAETRFTVVIEPLDGEDLLDLDEARRLLDMIPGAVARLSDGFALRAWAEESPGTGQVADAAAAAQPERSR